MCNSANILLDNNQVIVIFRAEVNYVMNANYMILARESIHPGEFLREEYMPEITLSVADFAQSLGVTRQTINEIVREKRNLSADMCLRLARFFNTTPQFWMNMQAKVDVWNANNPTKGTTHEPIMYR